MRWAGVAALVGVSAQGVLGILRIELHARLGHLLPLLHGGFAQLVFALLMGIAVVTSRSWQVAQPATPRVNARRFE